MQRRARVTPTARRQFSLPRNLPARDTCQKHVPGLFDRRYEYSLLADSGSHRFSSALLFACITFLPGVATHATAIQGMQNNIRQLAGMRLDIQQLAERARKVAMTAERNEPPGEDIVRHAPASIDTTVPETRKIPPPATAQAAAVIPVRKSVKRLACGKRIPPPHLNTSKASLGGDGATRPVAHGNARHRAAD
jgi:hypothetical protein